MGINYRAVLKASLAITSIIGLVMLPSLIVSIIYNEIIISKLFLIVLIPSLTIGIFIYKFTIPNEKDLRRRDAIIIIGLSWIIAILLGAIPYLDQTTFVNAIFESASGFSTTGATIFTDVESLPHALLFWRSFTNWFGGIGIIVIMLSLLPQLGQISHIIAESESTGSLQEKIVPKSKDMIKHIYKIYLAFSLLLLLLLIAGGMKPFDAFIHMFSTVSTGGFSNYNDGIQHFTSVYFHWIIIIFMALASLNFSTFHFMVSKHKKKFFRDEELDWFFIIVAISTILILFASVFKEGQSFSYIKVILFEVISTLSTTGYNIVDYNLWHSFSLSIITILVIIGGSSGSASGGIKLYRLIVIMKLVRRNIYKRLHPTAIGNIKMNNKIISSDLITAIVGFIFVYIGILSASIALMSLTGFNLGTVTNSVLYCLSNVAPSHPYDTYQAPGKLLLSLLMITGRLEFFTIILLFLPRFWNPNR